MPSHTYTQLLNIAAGFIDKEKASGILERQLKGKNLTPDSVAAKDLGNLMVALCTATSLYVPDAARKEELKSKLRALLA